MSTQRSIAYYDSMTEVEGIKGEMKVVKVLLPYYNNDEDLYNKRVTLGAEGTERSERIMYLQ